MNRAFIALAILLLAAMVVWLSSAPDSATQRMPEVSGFTVSKVTSIRIDVANTKPLDIRLEKGEWRLSDMGDGVKADADAVMHLLNDLANMQPVRVVARSSDHDDELGFGTSASRVILFDNNGAELFRVDVGKQGKDLLSTYVRVGEGREVLAVDRTLLWQVRRGREGWIAAANASAADAQPHP